MHQTHPELQKSPNPTLLTPKERESHLRCQNWDRGHFRAQGSDPACSHPARVEEQEFGVLESGKGFGCMIPMATMTTKMTMTNDVY